MGSDIHPTVQRALDDANDRQDVRRQARDDYQRQLRAGANTALLIRLLRLAKPETSEADCALEVDQDCAALTEAGRLSDQISADQERKSGLEGLESKRDNALDRLRKADREFRDAEQTHDLAQRQLNTLGSRLEPNRSRLAELQAAKPWLFKQRSEA